MKKTLVILLLLLSFASFGQTDRELLLELVKQQTKLSEQITETNKQIAENSKQIAITNTKVDGLQKQMDVRFEGVDKQLNTLLYVIVAMIGLLAILIGVIVWDRRAANAPLESKIATLEKEIAALKERETILETNFKKVVEKFPDLAL
jgi:cell division protein FtsB